MAVTSPEGYAGWSTTTAQKKKPVYDPYVTKDRVPVYTTPVANYGATNAGVGTNEYTTTAQRQQQNASVNKPVVNNGGGNGGGGNLAVSAPAVQSNPYESYMNKMISLYEKQLADEKARQEQLRQERIEAANRVKDARIKATNETYDNSMGNLNAAKDSSLREAYIKYMQEQRALPQQMQAYGINGGATETNLAKMKNAYGNNRTSILNKTMEQQRLIEQDRANAIAGAEADAANAELDAYGDASDYEASAVRDYNNGLLNVYQSALSKTPTYSGASTTAKSQITKNPWYDVAVGYLSDGSSTDEVITTLRKQGVSEDVIDAILYNWESTI